MILFEAPGLKISAISFMEYRIQSAESTRERMSPGPIFMASVMKSSDLSSIQSRSTNAVLRSLMCTSKAVSSSAPSLSS